MKNRIAKTLIIVLALTSVVFCALWQRAAHDSSELETLAQSEASAAYEHFSDFQKSGDDSDYRQGVAAFYAFGDAYGLLTEGTSKASNRVFCDEVYACMISSPERAKEHISEIAGIIKLLSEDVSDETGHTRMLELRNALKY